MEQHNLQPEGGSCSGASGKDCKKEEVLECAVCLQPSVHPVELPCGHIFCYLCVKGVTVQSRRCPMCRREIPQTYLEHPNLIAEASSQLKEEEVDDEEEEEVDDFQWFYEGRNGWWLYDERTAQELEQFYKRGDRSCELLIAGFLYSIDFDNMLQCRRNEPQRRRQIKRDLPVNVANKKGVAGIRLVDSSDNVQQQQQPTSSSTVDDDLSQQLTRVDINSPDEEDEQQD